MSRGWRCTYCNFRWHTIQEHAAHRKAVHPEIVEAEAARFNAEFNMAREQDRQDRRDYAAKLWGAPQRQFLGGPSTPTR